MRRNDWMLLVASILAWFYAAVLIFSVSHTLCVAFIEATIAFEFREELRNRRIWK